MTNTHFVVSQGEASRETRRQRVGYRRLGAYPVVLGSLLLLGISPAQAVSKKHTNPPLTGSYLSLTENARVFTTPAELKELAARINTPDSYSKRRFGELAGLVGRDLAADSAWDAAYSGCNIETYLYAFSYESQDAGHASKVQADLQLGPSAKPPAGSVVVASRLALYAALAKAGANAPAAAPSPDRASELAKRILLAWGEHGFRDGEGHFLKSASQFCLGDGKIDPASMTQVGLQVSRGVIYSVHAQDLLMYLGALDADEAKSLNAFHAAMYELIRNALNYGFTGQNAWHEDCERYSNHIANQLTGLLAIARLLDDKSRFEAALYGKNPSISVTLPWAAYFNRAIYGNDDTPNACYPNTTPDGLTNRPSFQTAVVEPGEIDDRYRNATRLQGIGYVMFTLERLYDMAEILRIAGFDPYGYRGAHGQSIEMATRYYACYAKGAGFGKAVTPDNASACPNFPQYNGKIVNGVEGNILVGAYRFPNDAAITDLEPSAKTAASSVALSLDSILFGRWRD